MRKRSEIENKIVSAFLNIWIIIQKFSSKENYLCLNCLTSKWRKILIWKHLLLQFYTHNKLLSEPQWILNVPSADKIGHFSLAFGEFWRTLLCAFISILFEYFMENSGKFLRTKKKQVRSLRGENSFNKSAFFTTDVHKQNNIKWWHCHHKQKLK